MIAVSGVARAVDPIRVDSECVDAIIVFARIDCIAGDVYLACNAEAGGRRERVIAELCIWDVL